MDNVKILGVPFSKMTLSDTVKLLQGKLAGEHRSQPGPFHLITANPEIVMAAKQQPELKLIVDAADLITRTASASCSRPSGRARRSRSA